MNIRKPKCHKNRKYHAKGLCETCYSKRSYKKNKIKKIKQATLWAKNNSERRNELNRQWRQRNPELVNISTRQWQKRNPELVKIYNRKSHLKYYYNLSFKKYNKLLKKQHYKCAIKSCKIKYSEKEKLSVDHNHKTNKVRGLLCGKCNRGIGNFNENIKLLKDAISYLHTNRE